MSGDLPQFASSAYASQTFDAASIMEINNIAGIGVSVPTAPLDKEKARAAALYRAVNHPIKLDIPEPKQETIMSKSVRRLIKVIVIDPDDNVPLAACVLYSGPEKLTDLDDQELFFELDIKKLLEEHNAKRITFVNKKVKEREEKLEPARIRDLKMVVVNIATF